MALSKTSQKASIGASASSFWMIFNTLQAIEVLSLIEVDYPDSLMEFFDGLEFTLLTFPEDWNPFHVLDLIKPPPKEKISGNLYEGGFYSPFFVVQHAAFILLVTLIATLWTIWSLCLCDRLKYKSSGDIQEELKLRNAGDDEVKLHEILGEDSPDFNTEENFDG